jgi:DNA polymerase III delta prime subunit
MTISQPWVEKYRPRNVSEVAYQDEVVQTLKKSLETANLPHLLFYGPPGTGKTSTALAIARQLYGPELMKTRVMELNASDERGINVVRQKVKAFAAASVGQPVPGYPCPPYKLLILDEADSMTQDAQNALRRTMEAYSKVTRFCFICNYVSRIIEPLASRCAKFRFRPLHQEVMSDRVHYICKTEGVELDADAFKLLAQVSAGDLRKAVTTLQSAVRLAGSQVTRSGPRPCHSVPCPAAADSDITRSPLTDKPTVQPAMPCGIPMSGDDLSCTLLLFLVIVMLLQGSHPGRGWAGATRGHPAVAGGLQDIQLSAGAAAGQSMQ